ncbi:hypothetical protein Vi05172_g4802 [Venturia inaequalis]|nr:hypothetical protein Vi05172_g4802 [Venturia inaequalis]
MASSSTASSDDLVAPYEIVFSCSLCQKTITDLYTKSRSNKSPNDVPDSLETETTKLWMTECGHVTCGEHFEGGGVPFHPVDERPKAACPVCVKERGDLTYTKLFGIVSCLPGEHDTAIPHEFFDTPPAESLTASTPATKAIRFQYLSMLRYGRAMRQRLDEAKQSMAAGDKRMRRHLAAIQALKEERTALQSSVEKLEAVEKKYQTYKDREPEIKHYLEQFSGIASENTLLKDQLVDLGYAVPQTEWSMKKPPPKGGAVPLGQAHGPPHSEKQQQPARSVDVHSRDQYTQPDVQHLSSSSSRKRRRIKDYHEDLTDADLEVLMNAPFQQRRDIQQSMLPPSHPTQRAVQRHLPTRRDPRESSSSQRYLESRSNVDARSRSNFPEVQMYHNGAWDDDGQEDAHESQHLRSYQPSRPALMSGEIGPASGRRGPHMDQQNVEVVPQPRFTKPAPELRNGNEGYARQTLPQSHSDSLQYQQNLNLSTRNLQTPAARLLPSRAASRSSFVRQSLISAPSRGNMRGPDSGYYSNSKPQYTSGYEQMDENYATAPPDRISQPLNSPFFKPHFNGPVPQQDSPVYQRGGTRQSEQLESGLRHLRMEPASQQPQPRMRPSLNALSFIDEPYTSTNQPIYAQQRGPFSQSQEQPYKPAVISRAGFIQDPRVPQQPHRPSNSIRLPSAMPSSSQPLAHTQKVSRTGRSIVRSIGGQGVRPNTNSYSPGGGYFPRTNAGAVSSRGIFSAAGRRSVKR